MDVRSPPVTQHGARWGVLGLLATILILTMSTWFAATAVLAQIQAAFALDTARASWLTGAVQLGFVAGALASSISGLTDRTPARVLLVGSATLAALSDLAMLAAPNAAMLLAARAITGVALAGVYPTALKVLASWFSRGRGLAMGAAVGALTLGSASPYLVRALATALPWSSVVVASAVAAAVAALLALRVKDGPQAVARPPFDAAAFGRVIRDRPLMLANLGYFGHMWEVYAVWGWFLAFATRAPAAARLGLSPALLTFGVVGIGAVGSLLGGVAADRFGRTVTAGTALAVSGLCALAIGWTFDGPAWLFAAIALVWGIAIVPDSAQFSAMVSELSAPDRVGAALALQVGIGFALTIVSIRLTPMFAGLVGWRWAFLLLVPGPMVGLLATAALRRLPEATRMAGGRR